MSELLGWLPCPARVDGVDGFDGYLCDSRSQSEAMHDDDEVEPVVQRLKRSRRTEVIMIEWVDPPKMYTRSCVDTEERAQQPKRAGTQQSFRRNVRDPFR